MFQSRSHRYIMPSTFSSSLFYSIFLVAALAIGVPVGNWSASALQTPGRGEGRAPAGLQEVAISLLMISSRPGGIAVALNCEDIQPAPLAEAWTVNEALVQVSGNAAGYRVLDSNGAVDLLPPIGAAEGLLSTKVDRFDYDGQRYAAVFAIKDIPSVREAVNRIAPNMVNGSVSAAPKIPLEPIHIHLRDTDLLGVLNAVVVAQHRGIWALRYQKCGSVRTVNLVFPSTGSEPEHSGQGR